MVKSLRMDAQSGSPLILPVIAATKRRVLVRNVQKVFEAICRHAPTAVRTLP